MTADWPKEQTKHIYERKCYQQCYLKTKISKNRIMLNIYQTMCLNETDEIL